MVLTLKVLKERALFGVGAPLLPGLQAQPQATPFPLQAYTFPLLWVSNFKAIGS